MHGRKATAVRTFAVSLIIVVVSLLPAVTWAETTITLKNAFIKKYKNRATITASFTVDKAHKKPNPASALCVLVDVIAGHAAPPFRK